ncbi:hypothetical protein PQX77_021047 [Marasmius sp. AFHP31]|nr:hypothetical protein PQX77_021047 [Marasmius sp. AFHP31]
MLLEESNAHENTEDADYRLELDLSSSQVPLLSPSSSQKQGMLGSRLWHLYSPRVVRGYKGVYCEQARGE